MLPVTASYKMTLQQLWAVCVCAYISRKYRNWLENDVTVLFISEWQEGT